MRQIDAKHLAYHTLIALYTIWLTVFSVLLGITIYTQLFYTGNALDRILLLWISLNFVIGTSLFFVLRLFGKYGMLQKFIFYSYLTLLLSSVAIIFLILNK